MLTECVLWIYTKWLLGVHVVFMYLEVHMFLGLGLWLVLLYFPCIVCDFVTNVSYNSVHLSVLCFHIMEGCIFFIQNYFPVVPVCGKTLTLCSNS